MAHLKHVVDQQTSTAAPREQRSITLAYLLIDSAIQQRAFGGNHEREAHLSQQAQSFRGLSERAPLPDGIVALRVRALDRDSQGQPAAVALP